MNGRLLVLIARHGTTQGNKQNVFRGRLNFPLDDKGESEAKALAEHISANHQIGLIVSSPMNRATRTASIVSAHSGAPVEIDSRLLPWNAGLLTGMKRNQKTEAVRDYYVRNADRPIPGGESIQDSEQRTKEILTKAINFRNKFGKIPLLAAHGSSVKAAETLVTGVRKPEGDSALIEPGGLAGVFQTDKGLAIHALFKEHGGESIS